MDRKPNAEQMEFYKKMRESRIQTWRESRAQMLDEGWERLMLWESIDQIPEWNPEVTDQDPPSVYVKMPIQPGRGLFLICAGGAFMYKAYKEGKPVADYFYAKGYNVAVLDYRVNPYPQTVSHADGLRAMRLLRANAGKWGIPADKIAMGGFSAGGMLTGMVSTRFDCGNPAAADPIEQISSRPDAALILYGAFGGMGAPQGGLGFDNEKQNQMARMNNVKNLHADCPPYFIFQTQKDDPALAMKWGLECAERGIPFVVHSFRDGAHGGGLYDGENETENIPHTHRWAELAAEWLEDYGF